MHDRKPRHFAAVNRCADFYLFKGVECCAAIYLLQSNQPTTSEDLGACVGLILDALDDVICSLEFIPAQHAGAAFQPARLASAEDQVADKAISAQDQPDGTADVSMQEARVPVDDGNLAKAADSALLWGLKFLNASANRCLTADKQMHDFLMQHASVLGSSCMASQTAMQDLISAIDNSQRIGLALLANAQAAILDQAGTLDQTASLSSFLQHICSSASIFEQESQQIATEIQRIQSAQQETESRNLPGATLPDHKLSSDSGQDCACTSSCLHAQCGQVLSMQASVFPNPASASWSAP